MVLCAAVFGDPDPQGGHVVLVSNSMFQSIYLGGFVEDDVLTTQQVFKLRASFGQLRV